MHLVSSQISTQRKLEVSMVRTVSVMTRGLDMETDNTTSSSLITAGMIADVTDLPKPVVLALAYCVRYLEGGH